MGFIKTIAFVKNVLSPILRRHLLLTAALILTGLFASLLEGLSLGLVIPILEGVKGSTSSVVPYPLNYISNLFKDANIISRIRWVSLFLFITIFARGVSLFLNRIITSFLQMKVLKHYRMACYNQLMNVGMQYINAQKSANLQTIVSVYTNDIGFLIRVVGALIPSFFSVIILLSMLVLLSWKMTLVSLAIVAMATIFMRPLAKASENSGKKYTEAFQSINRIVLDIIHGMKVIRLFGRQSYVYGKFEYEVDGFNKSQFTVLTLRNSVQPLFEIIGAISLALMLIAGSFFILKLNNGQGLELILTFIVIYMRITPSAMSFNQTWVSVKGDVPSYQKVCDFISPRDKPYITPGAKEVPQKWDFVDFNNVFFEYNKEVPVLRGISFQVKRGTKIGVVGTSGGGKSTIIELLLRFYDPQHGSISVGGINLKDLDIFSWRSRIGVVTQDTFLFHDTVRSNIGFPKPESTQEEIENAARKAYAHDFILKLPQGYDTIVGDRGVLLSGGQKQRLAIARAVITNPDIFIFDEATSSLDTESEEMVQKALFEVGRGRTVVSIAHRLSTIFNSDVILVLDNGKLAEKGTHQELIKLDGIYNRLVAMQMKNDVKQN